MLVTKNLFGWMTTQPFLLKFHHIVVSSDSVGKALDWDQRVASSRLTESLCCVLEHDTLSTVLVLVQLGKTGNHPDMTEKLLDIKY